MARNFVAASSQYLSNANAVVTAVPITMATWVYPTVLGNKVALSVGESSSNFNNIFDIGIRTGGEARALQNNAGGLAATATTTATMSVNTWNHIAGVFTTNSSRTIYLNGGNTVTDTTVKGTPTGLNVTYIGRRAANSAVYIDARIAEAAIWTAALDAMEIAALAKGVCPLLIRPTSLVFYAPLIGNTSPEIELRNSRNMTLNASPAKADHPRIILPSSTDNIRFGATAVTAGTTSSHQMMMGMGM